MLLAFGLMFAEHKEHCNTNICCCAATATVCSPVIFSWNRHCTSDNVFSLCVLRSTVDSYDADVMCSLQPLCEHLSSVCLYSRADASTPTAYMLFVFSMQILTNFVVVVNAEVFVDSNIKFT